MKIQTTKTEDQFITAYIECVFFADQIFHTFTGKPDDFAYVDDLDEDFKRESIIDCLAFYNRIACYLPDEHIEQAGHDFYLTRQGHGTGYWDRPEIYGRMLGDKFTKMAEDSGEVYPLFHDVRTEKIK